VDTDPGWTLPDPAEPGQRKIYYRNFFFTYRRSYFTHFEIVLQGIVFEQSDRFAPILLTLLSKGYIIPDLKSDLHHLTINKEERN